MTLLMNPVLSVNDTLDECFENKLFNLSDFQQIMDDEGNDPDLIFLMIIPKLLVCLITILMNFHAPVIVF